MLFTLPFDRFIYNTSNQLFIGIKNIDFNIHNCFQERLVPFINNDQHIVIGILFLLTPRAGTEKNDLTDM